MFFQDKLSANVPVRLSLASIPIRPVWGLRGKTRGNKIVSVEIMSFLIDLPHCSLSTLWILNYNVLPSHMCVDLALAPDSEHFLPENYPPLYLALTHTS